MVPYFSERADDEQWLRTNLHRNQIRIVLFSTTVAVAVFAFAYFFVPFYYGQYYDPTITFLAILLLNFILTSITSVTNSALTGLEKMNFKFIIVAISAPVNWRSHTFRCSGLALSA